MPLSHLIANNRRWAERKRAEDPEFFSRLAAQQNPEYLWIGCSDSRVPANQITGLAPGEVFVHRNVSNVVVHTDLNCLSVIHYAVEVLKVRHIMVVGHYGCGGVRAALEERNHGLIDNWLRHVQDVYHKHRSNLDALPLDARVNRLCELNVIEQVVNVCRTTIVQNAWGNGQRVSVHGWVYGLDDGLLHEMCSSASSQTETETTYRKALEHIGCRSRRIGD
ncbi:carbonic anhydrase [Sterolibacterium denitrificans]|uniref:Carbonic anhydrase 2 n=1 Tax=Sterolibacterium denitrificans TaxID=157592 RepID=A0A7Z7HPM9_9PROT|nr:carbonate dehydratase [Sterolibacterium denitrificans]SMB22353.1 carbonic anhydrase [Sterolibacterium denitrificans]